MEKKTLTGLIAAVSTLTSVFTGVASANAVSLLQNNQEWNNLVVNPVQSGVTDTSGFQDIIPQFRQFVQPERNAIPDDAVTRLDPSKLVLKSDNNVRVWFLNEGAAFRSQLAYEAIGDSNSQRGFIFQDISCINGNNNCEIPESDGVLNVGDYVDLGTVAGGSQLNFWLRANGANSQDPSGVNPETGVRNIYGANASLNPDNLEHVVAYEYNDYLLIGFEDLYGPLGSTAGGNSNSPADRDFNDVVFVVDIGRDNLATIPEPATALGLISVGAASILTLRRRRHNQADKTA